MRKTIPEQKLVYCDGCGVEHSEVKGHWGFVTFDKNHEWHSENRKFDYCDKCSDKFSKLLNEFNNAKL